MVAKLTKITQLHQDCVGGTLPKEIVINQVILCAKTALGRIYLNSRVLKHLYDKRTAAIYFLILACLEQVLSKPDAYYRNKFDKRGAVILIKEVKNIAILVSLEKIRNKHFEVVTAFEVKEKYLRNLIRI